MTFTADRRLASRMAYAVLMCVLVPGFMPSSQAEPVAAEASQPTELPEEGGDAAQSLSEEGKAAHARGDMIQAARLLEQSVQTYTRTAGEHHPDTLKARQRLAVAYRELGRYRDAEALLRGVLAQRTAVLGHEHALTLSAAHQLVVTLTAMENFQEALEFAERTLQARRNTLGDRHPDTLGSMHQLAVVYRWLGRTSERLALNEQVLQRRLELYGERDLRTLPSMTNLANTYSTLGRRADSIQLLERVVALRTELQGEGHPATARAMSNLALDYQAERQFDKAEAMLKKALATRLTAFGEQHPDVLKSLTNLGDLYADMKRYPEAIAQFERALGIAKTMGAEESLPVQSARFYLADAYLASGRAQESIVLLEQVLKTRLSKLGERHGSTLLTLSTLARAYSESGRPTEALALSTRYVAGAESIRAQPGLSVENRQSLFRRYSRQYRWFSLLHAKEGGLAEGFRLAELSKARTLLEGMVSQRASRAGAIPEEEQQRLDAIEAQVDQLSQQIAASDAADERRALEAKKNALVREFASHQQALRQRYPKYAKLHDAKILGSGDLAGLLAPETVAVSYVVVSGEVGAYLADHSGRLQFVMLGSVPRLTDAVDLLRRDFAAEEGFVPSLAADGKRAWQLEDGSFRVLAATASAPPGATALTDSAPVRRFLSERLLAPLSAHLTTARRWVIAPDGPLAQLPFETLTLTDSAVPAVQLAEIHYTQSLSVFALAKELQREYEHLPGRRSLLGIGNPSYAAAEDKSTTRGTRLRNAAVPAASKLSDLDPYWHALPGTEREVQSVAALFSEEAAVFTGAQASEQSLQALNEKGELARYRYLLFSAHGYLSADRPALSSIVLSLTQRTPQADGYITASEWPGYDLRSDLTVLSACDSGVGQTVSGEGVMGLPFALFVAGNVNTILTLWPIDDDASAEFVRRLFGHLRDGHTATEALALTKREFLGHQRFSAPRYWAPFILVGAG